MVKVATTPPNLEWLMIGTTEKGPYLVVGTARQGRACPWPVCLFLGRKCAGTLIWMLTLCRCDKIKHSLPLQLGVSGAQRFTAQVWFAGGRPRRKS